MTIILIVALRFGGYGFYLYHINLASEAAARLQQINENTAWGSIDNEIYCRIFAAHQASPCNRAAYHHTQLPLAPCRPIRGLTPDHPPPLGHTGLPHHKLHVQGQPRQFPPAPSPSLTG